MLVQCPSCYTSYRVADSLVTTPNPTFRCSRCKHIFVLGLKPEPGLGCETDTALTSRPAQEKDRELSFSFPPPEKNVTAAQVSEFQIPKEIPITEEPDESLPLFGKTQSLQTAMEQPGPPHVEEPLSALTEEREDSWSISTPLRPDEEPFTIPEENPASLPEPAAEMAVEFETDWQEPSPPLGEREASGFADVHRDRPVSAMPFISLFVALLLTYSLVTLIHQAQPRSVESFIKTIPWLGSSVLKNNHLRQGIALQSLRAGSQKILGNREVFVVSGVATNRNPVSVREVQVEGHIFNAEGKEIERQRITVGNPISSKIIGSMEAREIPTLQKLKGLKSFQIRPEESGSFVMVFLKPVGEIKEFSCRVVSAEGV